jgi:hypothetical protein
MTGRGVRIVRISGLALALVSGRAVPAVTAAVPAAPAAPAAPVAPVASVEEQRLDRAVPQEIPRRSGFDTVAPAFGRALGRADSCAEARRAVARQGSALWQRAVGRFDVERTNGAWRGGFADTENVSRTGLVPVPAPTTQLQWTTTTLPYREIVAADTGRFPVYDHTSVTEIPAGGPPSDRLGLRGRLPGGHVHTPVLQFAGGNTREVTGAEFVRDRRDIVTQVRAIVGVAVSTTSGPGRG